MTHYENDPKTGEAYRIFEEYDHLTPPSGFTGRRTPDARERAASLSTLPPGMPNRHTHEINGLNKLNNG